MLQNDAETQPNQPNELLTCNDCKPSNTSASLFLFFCRNLLKLSKNFHFSISISTSASWSIWIFAGGMESTTGYLCRVFYLPWNRHSGTIIIIIKTVFIRRSSCIYRCAVQGNKNKNKNIKTTT